MKSFFFLALFFPALSLACDYPAKLAARLTEEDSLARCSEYRWDENAPDLTRYQDRAAYSDISIIHSAAYKIGQVGTFFQELNNHNLEGKFYLKAELAPIYEKLAALKRANRYNSKGLKKLEDELAFNISTTQEKFLRAMVQVKAIEFYLPKWIGPLAQSWGRTSNRKDDYGAEFALGDQTYKWESKNGNYDYEPEHLYRDSLLQYRAEEEYKLFGLQGSCDSEGNCADENAARVLSRIQALPRRARFLQMTDPLMKPSQYNFLLKEIEAAKTIVARMPEQFPNISAAIKTATRDIFDEQTMSNPKAVIDSLATSVRDPSQPFRTELKDFIKVEETIRMITFVYGSYALGSNLPYKDLFCLSQSIIAKKVWTATDQSQLSSSLALLADQIRFDQIRTAEKASQPKK